MRDNHHLFGRCARIFRQFDKRGHVERRICTQISNAAAARRLGADLAKGRMPASTVDLEDYLDRSPDDGFVALDGFLEQVASSDPDDAFGSVTSISSRATSSASVFAASAATKTQPG